MIKKKTALTAGIVFLVLVFFAGCGENAGKKEYEKAMDAWKSGDLVRAKGLFQKSIRKTTAHEQKSVAWNQLGLIHWQLDEIVEAADAFGQSCMLTESLTGANLNLGLALYHSGRLDEAEVALNSVLGDNPKNQTAQAMLAMIEMKKRDWPGASAEISRTLNINPSSPAARNAEALAGLHETRDSEQAISRLKKILANHPNYAPAAYNLAVIFDLWLKNKGAAEGWYAEYLQIAGPDGPYTASATQALERLTGKAVSRPAVAEPQENIQDAARYMSLGHQLYKTKKYAEAVTAYQKAIQAAPKQSEAYYNLGLAYFQLKKYTDAAHASQAAVRLNPTNTNALYNVSLSYYYQKNWKQAQAAADDLKKLGDPRGDQMLQYISDARKR